MLARRSPLICASISRFIARRCILSEAYDFSDVWTNRLEEARQVSSLIYTVRSVQPSPL